MSSGPAQAVLHLANSVLSATRARATNNFTQPPNDVEDNNNHQDQQHQQQQLSSQESCLRCIHFYCGLIVLIFVTLLTYLVIMQEHWNQFMSNYKNATGSNMYTNVAHLLSVIANATISEKHVNG